MAVQVRCSCGYFMQLPDDWAGKQGRCPQCSKVLKIPATPAQARPDSQSPRSDANRQGAPFHGALDSGVDLTSPSSTDRTGGDAWWRRPVWIAAFVGGIALFATGLLLVLRGNSSKPDDRSTQAIHKNPDELVPADDDQPRSTVFRPQIKSDRPDQRSDTTQEGVEGGTPDMATYKQASADKPTGGDSAISWGLADFGVCVPPGITMIEIDGVRIPVRNLAELPAQRVQALVLPLGKHVVRFTKADTPRIVEAKRWFIDGYREAAARVQDGGRWNFDRLLDQSRLNLDRFTEPLVPHFWGNYYWQEGEFDAAARHYTWSLELAPTFAPAYFNLAALAHERGDDDTARRYLRLADLWNAQNAYGLAHALGTLRALLGESNSDTTSDEPDWYVSTKDELTVRDKDMVAVLHSVAEFSPRNAERAKILNNLGAYFEHVGKPEHALQSYRSAAGVLNSGTLSSEERRVIQVILENLVRVCRTADMPEYRRYERLQAMMR